MGSSPSSLSYYEVGKTYDIIRKPETLFTSGWQGGLLSRERITVRDRPDNLIGWTYEGPGGVNVGIFSKFDVRRSFDVTTFESAEESTRKTRFV